VSLADQLQGAGDAATALCSALAGALGEDTTLSAGPPKDTPPDTVTADAGHGAALAFRGDDDTSGVITFAASAAMAARLEQAAGDDGLMAVLGPALETAARALGELGGVELELDPATTAATTDAGSADGDTVVVFPILDADGEAGALTIRVFSTASAADDGESASFTAGGVDFGVDASDVLGDVEMGVTAELGRCRMSMRELLSITPGAVIDLDRAAGEHVDVLVNGKLIARGEVVVVDEEFGIRISEIVRQGSAAH
jgi:flagellar motor switch protein FliN/FliY